MQSSPVFLFDHQILQARRERVKNGVDQHKIVAEESAIRLVERWGDVKRAFPSLLNLSADAGEVARLLLQPLQSVDLQAHETLAYPAQSFDGIISNMLLHWVNDLPGLLAQIKTSLRPDGLFMAAMIGEQSLHELRACLMEAELAITGGVSPRVSPMIDLPTASGLLQRAGFALPVVDRETLTLTYANMFALMRDLRGMGATNVHTQRLRHPTRRAIFLEAARIYQDRFAESDGAIPATFELIFLHGWAAEKE